MENTLSLTYQNQPFDAYLAEPKGKAEGGIIVIHEVWGLTDHIKSIADRLAAEGYVALTPDLLGETDIAKHAGTLQLDLFNPETRNEAQPKLRALMAPMQEPGFAEKTVARLKVCFDELCNRPDTQRKVAAIGFCFGGSYSYSLAMQEPRLAAAIPFYGHASTDPAELRTISCPVRAFYGANDHGLVDGLSELEQAMKAASVDYEAKVYPDCGHAFFNDTNPFAYNEAAATDAWKRVLAFLGTITA